MEQYIWKQVGSVTERSLFLGKQKTNMERRRLLGKRTFALEKQKQNKCNVAILRGSKQIGGRKGAETMQYRILRALQLLPSARTKASVRLSTERKRMERYCNVAKAGGRSVAHGGAPYCCFWGRDDYFYARHGNRAVWGN